MLKLLIEELKQESNKYKLTGEYTEYFKALNIKEDEINDLNLRDLEPLEYSVLFKDGKLDNRFSYPLQVYKGKNYSKRELMFLVKESPVALNSTINDIDIRTLAQNRKEFEAYSLINALRTLYYKVNNTVVPKPEYKELAHTFDLFLTRIPNLTKHLYPTCLIFADIVYAINNNKNIEIELFYQLGRELCAYTDNPRLLEKIGGMLDNEYNSNMCNRTIYDNLPITLRLLIRKACSLIKVSLITANCRTHLVDVFIDNNDRNRLAKLIAEFSFINYKLDKLKGCKFKDADDCLELINALKEIGAFNLMQIDRQEL